MTSSNMKILRSNCATSKPPLSCVHRHFCVSAMGRRCHEYPRNNESLASEGLDAYRRRTTRVGYKSAASAR
eukprot:2798433-Pleurochrysis_carterae.AAC.1